MGLRIMLVLLAAVADILAATYDPRLRHAVKVILAKSPPVLSAAQTVVHSGWDRFHYDFLLMTVAAILQVAITLLGLYFAAISVVASTSYRGAFVAVRSLLLERESSKRLFVSMVFLASYTAVVLILLSAGVQLGFWTGLLILIFSVRLFTRFLDTGTESLAYLDPQRALAEQPNLIAADLDRDPSEWRNSLRPRVGLLPGLVETARQVGGIGAITDVFAKILCAFVRFRRLISTDLSARANERSLEVMEEQRQKSPHFQRPQDYLKELNTLCRTDAKRAGAAASKLEERGSIGAEFENALAPMAQAIYTADQEFLLARAASEILSAGSACGYLDQGNEFIALWRPLWRAAAREDDITEKLHLHRLKAHILSAPIVGVASGAWSLLEEYREKLIEVVCEIENKLRAKYADLDSAFSEAVKWAGDRKDAGSIFDPSPALGDAIRSGVIACGFSYPYIYTSHLQARLQRLAQLQQKDPAAHRSADLLRGLLKVQVLDALANVIGGSYIDQSGYGARLIEQIQPLVEQSLGKGQIEFYKAVAENARNARTRLLVAAFRHAEMVKQLQTEMGSDIFDPPPEVAGSHPFLFFRDAFSESMIWAGVDACDRLAAANAAGSIDASLLQVAQRAVLEQAEKWAELASRFEGSLTTGFIRRGLATSNRWFGTHAQNGNLTSDFRIRRCIG